MPVSDSLRRRLDPAVIDFLVNATWMSQKAALESVWFPQAGQGSVSVADGLAVNMKTLWAAVAMVGTVALISMMQASDCADSPSPSAPLAAIRDLLAC